MANPLVVVLNNDSTEVWIDDLGLSIQPSEQLVLCEDSIDSLFPISKIFDSNDLKDLVENTTLSVSSDGTNYLDTTDGISHISYESPYQDLAGDSKFDREGGVITPKVEGDDLDLKNGTLILRNVAGTGYVVIQRSSGNASISVYGTDARALYLNLMKQVTQLGGSTSDQYVVISDSGDGQLLGIFGDGVHKIRKELLFLAGLTPTEYFRVGHDGSGYFVFAGDGNKIRSVLDQDNMSSDSATALITQQSAKAYNDKFPHEINFAISDGSNPYQEIEATSWKSVRQFIFRGTNNIWAPTAFKVAVKIPFNQTGHFQLVDLTHGSNVVASMTKVGYLWQFPNGANWKIVTDNSLANLPSGESVFELQAKAENAGGKVYLSSMNLVF